MLNGFAFVLLALWLKNRCVPFLFIGNGGSELQALFRSLPLPMISSGPCPNILISGSHLVALLQRITMKRLSADQSLPRPLEEKSTRS